MNRMVRRAEADENAWAMADWLDENMSNNDLVNLAISLNDADGTVCTFADWDLMSELNNIIDYEPSRIISMVQNSPRFDLNDTYFRTDDNVIESCNYEDLGDNVRGYLDDIAEAVLAASTSLPVDVQAAKDAILGEAT